MSTSLTRLSCPIYNFNQHGLQKLQAVFGIVSDEKDVNKADYDAYYMDILIIVKIFNGNISTCNIKEEGYGKAIRQLSCK